LILPLPEPSVPVPRTRITQQWLAKRLGVWRREALMCTTTTQCIVAQHDKQQRWVTEEQWRKREMGDGWGGVGVCVVCVCVSVCVCVCVCVCVGVCNFSYSS